MLGGRAVENSRSSSVAKCGLTSVASIPYSAARAVCHAPRPAQKEIASASTATSRPGAPRCSERRCSRCLRRAQIGTAYPYTRYADCHGMLAVVERPAQHGQIFLHAGRRQMMHVGKTAQHGNIKERKMRLGHGATRLTHQTPKWLPGASLRHRSFHSSSWRAAKSAVHTKDWLGARARKRGDKRSRRAPRQCPRRQTVSGGSAKLGRKAHDVRA